MKRGLVAAILVMAPPLSIACERPTTVTELADAVAEVQVGWQSMSTDAVRNSAQKAERVIGCLGEALTPIDAAEYYRASALSHFLAGDPEGARVAYRAALTLQPNYALPASIAFESHPLRTVYKEAQAMQAFERIGLIPPATGWLNIDGKRANNAPDGRPYVFQHLDDNGSIARSLVVSAGSIPRYDQATAPTQPITTDTTTAGETITKAPARTSRPLLIAGIAAGAVGGAGIITAGILRSDYKGSSFAETGERTRIISANHAIATTGITLTAVGGGLGATALFVGKW